MEPTVTYSDCDCVPGHRCDCWDYRAEAAAGPRDQHGQTADDYERLAEAAAGPRDEGLPRFEVGQVVGDLQPGRRRHDWCSVHGDIGPAESIDAHARRAHGASAEDIRKAQEVIEAEAAAGPRDDDAVLWEASDSDHLLKVGAITRERGRYVLWSGSQRVWTGPAEAAAGPRDEGRVRDPDAWWAGWVARGEAAAGPRDEGLRDIILDGGLRLPGFDHWRERSSSKPSDPDDVRWDCSCGYSGSPDKVRRHWHALLPEAAAGSRDEGGTLTRCPLEGVHEHAFRGPHVFREWEPPTGPRDHGEKPDLGVMEFRKAGGDR